jgi:RNA polymerase sigma-70 factor, ECF subfamily
LMRLILVDHARGRQTGRRGKGRRPLSIEALIDLPEQRELEVLLVDEALKALAREDQRQAQIVEMRFFAGLNYEEIGEILGIHPSTIKREWKTARLFLLRELSQG